MTCPHWRVLLLQIEGIPIVTLIVVCSSYGLGVVANAATTNSKNEAHLVLPCDVYSLIEFLQRGAGLHLTNQYLLSKA